MNIQDLLTYHQPPPPRCQRIDGSQYWLDAVWNRYQLGLPLNNPYPLTWHAGYWTQRGIEAIETLSKNGPVTKEAFADLN